MRVLSSLDKLRVLRFCVKFEDTGLAAASQPDGFEALEALVVRGQHEHVEKALGMVASSRLRRVELFIVGEMVAAEFKAFLSRVGRMV